VAADISPKRLRQVQENCRRLKVTRCHVVCADVLHLPFAPASFDAILLDVPCSNTAVLARRVESRWRINPELLTGLSALQLELLISAARHLKPGGRLLYSTCSLEPEENEQVVESVLQQMPELSLVRSELRIPSAEWNCGAFLALFGKAKQADQAG
jgi:16S rRNA (cytosine967-C5)-methyltransferase